MTGYDANQAREAVLKVEQELAYEELQEIIQEIKEAAEDGKKGIYIRLSAYAETIKELRERGFKLEAYDDKWLVGW